jgi:hypothetical protein
VHTHLHHAAGQAAVGQLLQLSSCCLPLQNIFLCAAPLQLTTPLVFLLLLLLLVARLRPCPLLLLLLLWLLAPRCSDHMCTIAEQLQRQLQGCH